MSHESDLLHARVERLANEKDELYQKLMMTVQMNYKDQDMDNEEIKQLKDEIEELKENLDRKEYLLQY